MKENSREFVLAYDGIMARVKLYRELCVEHDCSIGKFLADLVSTVLNSAYIPTHPDERVENKVVHLEAYRNLQAIVKESDGVTGKFSIRPVLLPYFEDLEASAFASVKLQGLQDEETTVIAQIVTLCNLYKQGKLYAHEVNDLLLRN